jgi:5-methylcytosine-specific restriction endonuclease McrA
MGKHDRWYDTAAWQRRRRYQLLVAPLCAYCAKVGRVTPATVVDHVEPHRGDINAFTLGALQSLCRDHHNRDKQRIERRGSAAAFDGRVGVDGWPVDARHPSNQPRPQQRRKGP